MKHFVGVDSLVDGQFAGVAKRHSALPALVRFLTAVQIQVLPQVLRESESFTADMANIFFLLIVTRKVPFQVVFV